jgi:hypothetical protein
MLRGSSLWNPFLILPQNQSKTAGLSCLRDALHETGLRTMEMPVMSEVGTLSWAGVWVLRSAFFLAGRTDKSAILRAAQRAGLAQGSRPKFNAE